LTAEWFCIITKILQSLKISGLEKNRIRADPGIKTLKFPVLESHGKGHTSWKTQEKCWNSKVVVLEMLISGISIAN